ncbi:beta-ribofuranosylaminobenzene 5'-phosphate synthase [Bathymodiolus japonicus methanotrophic gill symbiont]|uniref:beta-ribofuranosylaminobenzene 5'-phosphate synthase family protein n=1 Tax=Bathymodiolus japonicus methanotrophic gill symbiont TaxID=113269 RepID=UPI001B6075F0|nr:beta-ribofuranosylaminobenzene 5'-phosphate synthase family protein [Bathymodiolus japonicus methanotrophic gill symbiont]GFO71107.1 beta-ribofuranosylaminobenzene 5'-phosphate synthase [Bathymodiolus japonicus methanotrophic gill symbiont]
MKATQNKITVIAPARLHMGFIDLSGSLGRHFGSIGVALNEINTRLSISYADQLLLTGIQSERALQSIRQLCDALNVPDKLRLDVSSSIPEHVGLGSGTQLAIALGLALSAYYDLGLNVRDIARLTARGARSGIGIAIFEQGGLVVDGGRGEHTITPPVISRMNVPEDWRFILVFDKRGQGLHGDAEIQAFKELPTFPQQEAARLCYLLMMQGLPALAEDDLSLFGDVITQLQSSVGAHFASAQGGIFTSNEVAAAVQFLQDQGAVAIGQTSWGPTGFCAAQGVELAEQLKEQVEQKFSHFENLSILVASARNSGGEVKIERALVRN